MCFLTSRATRKDATMNSHNAIEAHVRALYERYASELQQVRAEQRVHVKRTPNVDDADAELSYLLARDTPGHSLCVELGASSGYGTSWLLRAVDARDASLQPRRKKVVVSIDTTATAAEAVYHPRWKLHVATDVTRFGSEGTCVTASDHQREFERVLAIVKYERTPLSGAPDDYCLEAAPPRIEWPFAWRDVAMLVIDYPASPDPRALGQWVVDAIVQPLQRAATRRVAVMVRNVFTTRSPNAIHSVLLKYLQENKIAYYTASGAFPDKALRLEHVRWRAFGIDDALTPVHGDTAYRNASLLFFIDPPSAVAQ